MLDDFERADTSGGDLGTPETGDAWTLTGAGIDHGRIKNGRFVTDPGQTVYAYQNFSATPREMGGKVSWAAGSGSTPGDGVLLCSADSGIFQNCIHFGFHSEGWFLQKVISGSFTSIANGSYTTTPGVSYDVSMVIDGDTVIIMAPDGSIHSYTDTDFSTLQGTYCTWELLNDADPSSEARWDSVYAYPSAWGA